MKMNYASKVRISCGSIVITNTVNPVKIGDDINFVWFSDVFDKPKIEIGTVTEIFYCEPLVAKRKAKSEKK